MSSGPPPVAFLPGASGFAGQWRPVADRLRGQSSLLVEYPGFAGVPPDPTVRSLSDLSRVVLARLPATFDMVSFSMGGVLALRAALAHPERVRRLVLAATSGGIDVRRLGGADWREGLRARMPAAPTWFLDDSTDVTEQLSSLRAPTLLVFGDADPLSPVRVGEFLQARIPNSRLEIVPGGTHDMEIEQPNLLARLIQAHLDAP